jgi:MFS family permease
MMGLQAAPALLGGALADDPSSGQEVAVRVALGLYIGYNVVATVVSVPAGRVGDRWDAPPVLQVGVAFVLLAYLGFAVAGSLALLVPAFLNAGAGIGLVETAGDVNSFVAASGCSRLPYRTLQLGQAGVSVGGRRGPLEVAGSPSGSMGAARRRRTTIEDDPDFGGPASLSSRHPRVGSGSGGA